MLPAMLSTTVNVCLVFTLILAVIAQANIVRKLRSRSRPKRSIEESNGNPCFGTLGSNFENLHGICMFQYECQQLDGRSIGACSNNNHLAGTCCVYDNSRQNKQLVLTNGDADGNNYLVNLYEPSTGIGSTYSTYDAGDMSTGSQTYYYYPSPTASSSSGSSSSYYYPQNTYYETIPVVQTVQVPTLQTVHNYSDLWTHQNWNTAENTRSSVRPPMLLSRTTKSYSNSHNSISSNSIHSWPTDYQSQLNQFDDIDSQLLVISSNNRQSTTRGPSSLVSELDPASSYPYYPSNTYPITGSSDPQYGWTSSTANQNPLVSNHVIEDVNSNHFPVYPPLTSYPTNPSPSVSPSQSPTVIATAGTVINTTKNKKRKKPSLTTNKPNRWNVAPSTVSSTTSTSETSGRTCGIRPLRPTGRVVGGRNAQFGEWPWQVLIKESSWLGFFMKSKCGGVLIDYKWVLTAAHCQPGVMGSLIVVLGQHDQNSDSQKLKPVMKTVKRMIVHRDYNPETFDNDIALLELDVPFEAKPHILPICMPDSDENYVGKFAHVAGYGKLSYGGMVPSVMQTVKLPIIDNHNCQKMFADAGHYKYIRDHFLCAGYPQGGKDTCEGDSGGPLMVQRDGIWTLIGTVSHGIKCAEPNMPGVYMKTYSYLNWIHGITGRR